MKYNFKFKPNNHQRKPKNFMKEIGYEPYRPIQPNGYSDLEKIGCHLNYSYAVSQHPLI